MQKRKEYKGKKVKTYEELKKYLEIVISFNKNENYEDILKRIDNMKLNSNVWALFGKNESGEWNCLQVANAKDIRAEIDDDVKLMFLNNYEDLVSAIASNEKVCKDSTFYMNVYEMDSKNAGNRNEKRKFAYSKMKRDFSEFMVCTVKVEEYLDTANLKIHNHDLMNIIEIACSPYAEAKFAYETLAYYWNMYNSGVDGQAIMKFLEMDN
ncbi:hypothetical protein AB2T90_21385 [Clostridium butyricum]|uniref:hypothetical protein n=1 Tax=Clostridium butyricum TaxID=1492 RepID=UPI0006E54FEB|nr:hypothetical protein AK964_16235 [Clostridium butyricum]